MRIRSKILLACLSLTAVTLILGGVSLQAQTTLGQIAVKLYDEAFMSLSYLRSAQNTLSLLGRDLGDARAPPDDLEDRLDSAGEDLEVAEERALSPQGRAAAHELRTRAAELAGDFRRAGRLPTRRDFADIAARFDAAVARNAEDGSNARQADRSAIARVARWTVVVMGVAVAVALAITFFLTRAIVPALRYAVGIAAAIADGRLDNRIRAEGGSETSVLLRALATMQSGIADQVAQIEELMALQARTHASAMASQGERFEAALDNMAQGLCMVDEAGCLLVRNRRFVEMFGPAPAGTPVRSVLPPELVVTGVAETGAPARKLTCRLPDDRIFSITQKTMGAAGWVATYEDVTEKHLLEARIAHMARHDALTGLPNRAQFLEQIGPRLAQVRRGGSLAVLCIDLESFKQINDEAGHQIGNELLRAVGRRLLEVTRKADLAARLAGDEFAIIQSSLAQPIDAQALAQRVIASLAEPFMLGGRTLTIAVSIGIALTDDGRTTPEELLNNADLALERAKLECRGGYRFFDAALDAAMQARRLLELDLRRAIAERQFVNYYQPLVDTQTRAVCGFEALVRWRHPTRGMVPPNDFITLAEETGLIAQIGRQVLEQACRDATGWPDRIRVAVNLSPLQFRDRNLANDVRAILAEAKLDPTRLELEITESLLLQDDADTLKMLHEVRACGVSISMDDFGTGYSSLSYLRRFPFDKIKVDGSFVRSLDERREALPIVRAVIALGKSMGMRVIAEGVETERQLALLRSEGCEQVQGYLFSKPLPFDAFATTFEPEPALHT